MQTRLQRPLSGNHIIARFQLFAQLDNSLNTPLTLISAPAGYGKTTLVAHWLEQQKHQNAWLSLDPQDNDLQLFVEYFVSAVQTQFPDIGLSLLALSRAMTLPEPNELVRMLISALSAIDQDFLLVFDDYHVIHNVEIHKLLADLLRHPPRKLHLILITRSDISLPLVKLRASGQLTEIRAEDLQFSTQETDDFLRRVLHIDADDLLINQLARQTEGWAAGLRLLSHSLQNYSEMTTKLKTLHTNKQHTYQYFAEEILAQIPAETRQFLIRTSILEMISPELGNRLLGLPDGHPNSRYILDWLWQRNLFTSVSDIEHNWYRYHTLFQEFLLQLARQEMTTEEIDALHRIASNWFEEEGFLDDGLKQAVASSDPQDAQQFVIRNRYQLLNREQWHRLERWLEALTGTAIEGQPELLLSHAMLANNRGRWQVVDNYLAKAETLLRVMPDDDYTQALWGEVYLLRGARAAWGDDGTTLIHYGQLAAERLPWSWRLARIGAEMLIAAGHQMCGETQIAFQSLYRLYEQEYKTRQISQAMTLLFLISLSHWRENDLLNMRVTADTLLKLSATNNYMESNAAANYFLGCAAYYTNDLEAAEKYLSQTITFPYLLQTFYYVQACCALATTYGVMGHHDRATSVLDDAMKIVMELQNSALIAVLKVCRIEIAFAKGYYADDSLSLPQIREMNLNLFHNGFYTPAFTYLKLCLLQNTAESRSLAHRIALQLQEHLTKIHNPRAWMKTQLYQAWLARLQGEHEAALFALKEAIRIGETGDAIRPFLDLGTVLDDLLRELALQYPANTFLRAIVSALDTSHVPALTLKRIEPLSKRELEILRLLDANLTNGEISLKLFIAPGTVKQHTHRIYRKLGVSNREQAVNLARTLRIL